MYDGLRNATEITSPSNLPYRPSSVLRQPLHSRAMRLLSRLEYERSFDATWGSYCVRIPNNKNWLSAHCFSLCLIERQ
jgi:hypothetical protein